MKKVPLTLKPLLLPFLFLTALDKTKLSTCTNHFYDPSFLSSSLLFGDDVLGKNHAAEQNTHTGASRGSDLHHGRPVHDGPPFSHRPARRPISPVLPPVNRRLPSGAITQSKIVYTECDPLLWGQNVCDFYKKLIQTRT